MLDKDLHTKYIYVEGYKIRYLDFGYDQNYNDYDNYSQLIKEKHNNKVLVLLHDILLTSESWLTVVPELSKYYRIIIPDLIGFGYSDKPHVDYTFDFSIDFLKKFLKLLNVSDVNIIGSSDGGLLALEYAINYGSEVEKLVLVSPTGTMRYVSTTLKHYTGMALYPTYENISRILQQMIYAPKMISETLIYDLINRIKIPNFKFSFMSKLMNLNDHSKLTTDRLNIDVPTLII